MKLFQRLFFSLVSTGSIYYLSLLLGQGRSSLEEYAVYAAIGGALVVLAYNLSKLLTERDDERTNAGLEAHKILGAAKVHNRATNSATSDSSSAPLPLARATREPTYERDAIVAPTPTSRETRNTARAGGTDSQRNGWENHGGIAVLVAVLLGLGGISLLATKLAAVGVMLLAAGGGIIRLLMNGTFDHDEQEKPEKRWPTEKEMEMIAAGKLEDPNKAFYAEENTAEEAPQAALTPDSVMDPKNPADARWLALAAKRDALVKAALEESENSFLLGKRNR